MREDLSLPYWEINSRQAMAQEINVTEDDAKIIETYDRHKIGLIHLMQNVKGSRYLAKLDEE